MGVGMGIGSSKSKRNTGVWCVLLVGLLLSTAAHGWDCYAYCGRAHQKGSDEYLECIDNCTVMAHLHLKQGEAVLPSATALARGQSKNQEDDLKKANRKFM
jgi:hypothetical protein